MKDKHTRNDRETAQGKIRLKKCVKTKQNKTGERCQTGRNEKKERRPEDMTKQCVTFLTNWLNCMGRGGGRLYLL